MRFGIGIDTGGTYTDAVIYDFETDQVVGSAKALTTRHDLSIGILEALDRLPCGLSGRPELISLSTTLATNACVEDKTGRAKLIFLGGDAKVIDRYGGDYGLPPSEEIYLQESHTTFSGGFTGEFDWERFADKVSPEIAKVDGIGIIEMNAIRNGAVLEKQARDFLLAKTDIPVVCGHELSAELSCLQRGAGTLLNAGLFPLIKDFIAAIKKAMAERGIDAPVVIVRSDGSLMGEEFAALRPVETLLCGPAASVMGAVALAREDNCVVVDMGGTTTDIAIIHNGIPVRVEDGIAIGKWRTFVKGLDIHTIGLGGDSAVHYRDCELLLEDYRLIPLCIGASAHPGMVEQLSELVRKPCRHTRFLHEFFVRIRDISASDRYTDMEKRFCDALAAGPLIRRAAAAAVGRDEYTLDVGRLLREGVVQVCGLTPTDIMHLRGDFSQYDSEASRLGAEFVAHNLDLEVDRLGESIYAEIKRKMYVSVVRALLENEKPEYRQNGIEPAVEQLIRESYDTGGNSFVTPKFHTDHVLVGIGAPIHLFLDDVAARLGTRAIVPHHSEVANALGAIVGKIHANREVLVRPSYHSEGIACFTVLGVGDNRNFKDRESAEEYAMAEASRLAREDAVRRGAVGEITVSCHVDFQEGSTREGPVYMGSTVLAHAVGSVTL